LTASSKDISLGNAMKIPQQRDFLLWQVFSMTLAATTQRAKMYANDTQDRRAFQAGLRTLLEKLSKGYKLEVNDAEHLANIEELTKQLSEQHGTVLVNGRFRIGQSQKALNLYLKYLWCLGEIAMPPHCPIDAIVLAHVTGFKEERWTQLDSIERYQQIIEAARHEAKGVSLAVWELGLYNGSG
jgi:hypothetical protein